MAMIEPWQIVDAEIEHAERLGFQLPRQQLAVEWEIGSVVGAR